jgi:hypothetical protein
VPALANVNWNDAPASWIPESNTPSRDVTECDVPEKVQCTVSPTLIVLDAGKKSKSSTVTETDAPRTDAGDGTKPVRQARTKRLSASRAATRRAGWWVIGC